MTEYRHVSDLIPDWVAAPYFPKADEERLAALGEHWTQLAASTGDSAGTVDDGMRSLSRTYAGDGATAARDAGRALSGWLESQQESCTKLAETCGRASSAVHLGKLAMNARLKVLETELAWQRLTALATSQPRDLDWERSACAAARADIVAIRDGLVTAISDLEPAPKPEPDLKSYRMPGSGAPQAGGGSAPSTPLMGAAPPGMAAPLVDPGELEQYTLDAAHEAEISAAAREAEATAPGLPSTGGGGGGAPATGGQPDPTADPVAGDPTAGTSAGGAPGTAGLAGLPVTSPEEHWISTLPLTPVEVEETRAVVAAEEAGGSIPTQALYDWTAARRAAAAENGTPWGGPAPAPDPVWTGDTPAPTPLPSGDGDSGPVGAGSDPVGWVPPSEVTYEPRPWQPAEPAPLPSTTGVTPVLPPTTVNPDPAGPPGTPELAPPVPPPPGTGAAGAGTGVLTPPGAPTLPGSNWTGLGQGGTGLPTQAPGIPSAPGAPSLPGIPSAPGIGGGSLGGGSLGAPLGGAVGAPLAGGALPPVSGAGAPGVPTGGAPVAPAPTQGGATIQPTVNNPVGSGSGTGPGTPGQGAPGAPAGTSGSGGPGGSGVGTAGARTRGADGMPFDPTLAMALEPAGATTVALSFAETLDDLGRGYRGFRSRRAEGEPLVTQYGPDDEVAQALPGALAAVWIKPLVPGEAEALRAGEIATVRGLVYPRDDLDHLTGAREFHRALGLGYVVDGEFGPTLAHDPNPAHVDVLAFAGLSPADVVVPLRHGVDPTAFGHRAVVRDHAEPWLGTGQAPGSTSHHPIAEFEVLGEATVPVPHLAELWRIHADGTWEHLSTHNARHGAWSGEVPAPAERPRLVDNGLYAQAGEATFHRVVVLSDRRAVLVSHDEVAPPGFARTAGGDARRVVDHTDITRLVDVCMVGQWRGCRVVLRQVQDDHVLVDFAGTSRAQARRNEFLGLAHGQWQARWVPFDQLHQLRAEEREVDPAELGLRRVVAPEPF